MRTDARILQWRLGGVEELGHQGDGQTDYVEIAAFNAGNPAGGAALDGVGTGFVERFAGGDVGGDLLVAEGEEFDGGNFGDGFSVICGDDGDAGEHAMSAAGEKVQHAGGVGGGFWLGGEVIVGGG